MMEIINALVKVLIRALMFTLYITSIPFVWIRSIKKPQRCPPITNKILLMPASELAAKIRARELTSEEIVTAYVNRCREVNPLLNAVVQERFEMALEEAREVDQYLITSVKTEHELANETPLLGIPVTVKESIAVKGMSHAAGRKTENPLIASIDADAVRRAKKAGAIPLLVSNTPEMCMCWETYNNVTGTTWNPYDTRKTPGGSSGGEAALLGAGASVLSISSDIGGSARLPAMFCGVFGHKPTPGWIPTDGHTPDCDDAAWPSFFTIGPMVRYAVDLKLFLKILTQSEVAKTQLSQEVRLGDIKFYYMENCNSFVTGQIDREIIDGIHRFIKHLDNVQGIKVQQAEIPDLKYAFEAAVMVLLELNGVDTIFKKGSDPHEWSSVTWEVLKYISCGSSHILTTVAYGPVKKLVDKFPKSLYKWMHDKNNAIRRQFQELLGDNGVLIFPTFTTAAHYPYEIYHKNCDVTYMMIFNSIGLPVTQCPVGMNKDGLPIGFQIVGNVGCDHLTIAAAQEVERAFGGWQEPPSSGLIV